MAEDDDISRRYRELPRDEPPRQLDDAIRAAARRAVHMRPAPLVVPTGRQRWYFPLAAAAIIILAVAVTMHVEREQPGEEIVSAPAAPAGAPSAPQELMREVPPEKPKPAPGARELRAQRDAVPPPELQKAPEKPAAVPPAAPAPTQDAINSVQEAARAETAAKPVPSPDIAASSAMGRVEATVKPSPPTEQAAPARPQAAPAPRMDESARQSSQLAKFADRSPEQWLQGIADLRQQGRHEEADRALAEFRKRYPDYKIPEAMIKKVEKRAR